MISAFASGRACGSPLAKGQYVQAKSIVETVRAIQELRRRCAPFAVVHDQKFVVSQSNGKLNKSRLAPPLRRLPVLGLGLSLV